MIKPRTSSRALALDGSHTPSQELDLASFMRLCKDWTPSEPASNKLSTRKGRSRLARREAARWQQAVNVAHLLLSRIPRNERAEAFDMLVQTWQPANAVAALCEAGWEQQADCLEWVAQAKCLRCTSREVKTVAAYHSIMGIGGAERVAATLVNLWHDLSYRVVFFSDCPREACAYDIPADVVWVELPDSSACTPAGYRERAHALAAAVKEYGIDAFVYHQWWNKVLTWDALLLKTLNVPTCLVCHSVYELFFLEANPDEYDRSRVLRHLDGVVALSDFDRLFWERFNPRVWRSINPLTVQPDPAVRAELEGSNVVWVGRLSAFDKQPAEAVEIMAQVIAQIPEATLTIVGPGSEVARTELETLARERSIADKVSFVGPSNDLAPHYLNASVHLLTSRLEGWCLALSESKAYGLPCVMYELPYLTLTQGERGLVAVEQGNREAAAAAIVNLLRSKTQRQQLGEEAFEHIVEVASFDLAALWKDVFATLAQGSPKREGFELFDAHWNLLLQGFKDSTAKAAADPPIRPYLKRFGRNLAHNAFDRVLRK